MNVIAVQTDPIVASDALQQLSQDNCIDGAVVSFTGLVRNANLGDKVESLFLEHYPGMTEKALEDIVAQARKRWPLGRVTVLHRVGQLYPNDEIVFVGATSAHRKAAFAACEYIMDILKTSAPFWKKETTSEGQRWVAARDSDTKQARQWHHDKPKGSE